VSDQFLAEIRIFPYTFNPPGWAWCDGQLIPITQNTSLFSLLGTIYGGDGKSTFALPDLQGAAPMHPTGLNGSFGSLGQQGGSQSVSLLTSEMPAHSHTVSAGNFPADVQIPTPDTAIARSTGGNAYQSTTNANLTPMSPNTLSPAGGSLPHNNMQPYGALMFNIALQGVYPPRK
jgi:microcystin-dependent protein